MIKFFVSGTPAPQGSKRHVGNGRMIESSKKLKPWREAVRRVAAEHAPEEPYDVALRVSVDFYLPRPKRSRFGKHPAGVPDIDKLLRSTFDGITAGGLWIDDSRAVRVITQKHWTDDNPGASITVEPLWDALERSLADENPV